MVLDQAAILELIDQLRVAVPPEVAQARRITEEATRITERAREEGDAVIARAQEQAARMLEDRELVQMAKQRAEEIIDSAGSGIMVARGDLGVELPIEEVPGAQKRLIALAGRASKPAITATQMLATMVRASRPTRAEVTDVANAIYDGTDAVMLSEETAIGDYPVEAVRVMDRIARVTDPHLR